MARMDDNDPDDPGANAGDQLSLEDLVKPADWPEGKNWGTLTIDASFTPADIAYPTDLTLKKKPRSRKSNAAILRQFDYLQRNFAAIAIDALIFSSQAFQR